jgi:transcriptional regulator with XRE-family HTH domain
MTLAEFAGVVGVCEGVVASIEYGGRPSQRTLEKLATFFQLSVNELSPDGSALKRRAPRHQATREEPTAERARAELLERLVVLHAELKVAHGRAIAAVRANDLPGLTAARQRQAALLAQQVALMNAHENHAGVAAERRREPEQTSAG